MLAQADAHALDSLVCDEQVAAAPDDVPGSICLSACVEYGDELVDRCDGCEEIDRTAYLEGGVCAHGLAFEQTLGVNRDFESVCKGVGIHGAFPRGSHIVLLHDTRQCRLHELQYPLAMTIVSKGRPMIAEYKNDKVAFLSALEQADANLHANVATYAVVETEDPMTPFEICLVHERGAESDAARLLNERLFDHAFLDFGYKEVRSEDNLEGVVYAPIEELFGDKPCIGVAPRSMFDDDLTRVRMARGAEEDDVEEDADAMCFTHFLKAVDGRVIDGGSCPHARCRRCHPGSRPAFQIRDRGDDASQCVVAFQRTQRMWIQQKSSYLLFDGAHAEPDAFASRSLRVGTTFDFALFGDKLLFRNLRALEILFKFNKLVSQRAKDYADTLDGIVADFEKLDERIEASRGVANKLLKMQREGHGRCRARPRGTRIPCQPHRVIQSQAQVQRGWQDHAHHQSRGERLSAHA